MEAQGREDSELPQVSHSWMDEEDPGLTAGLAVGHPQSRLPAYGQKNPFCSSIMINPLPSFQFQGKNPTNQINTLKDNVLPWPKLPIPCSSQKTWEFFFGRSAGDGGPSREDGGLHLFVANWGEGGCF